MFSHWFYYYYYFHFAVWWFSFIFCFSFCFLWIHYFCLPCFSNMLTSSYIYLLQTGSQSYRIEYILHTHTHTKRSTFPYSPTPNFMILMFSLTHLHVHSFGVHCDYHHFHKKISIFILCTGLFKWFPFQLWFFSFPIGSYIFSV